MAGRIMMRGVVALAIALVWSMCLQATSGQGDVIVTTESELSVREGESVTLVCTYTPRTEPFEFGSLQWRIGTTTFASFACPTTTCTSTNSDATKYTLDVDMMFSGNLTIAAVTLDDDDTYQCQVLLMYGSGESTLRLIVNVPPQTINIMSFTDHESGDMVPVVSGKTYTLTCRIQPGANPPAAIQWSADTVEVTQETQNDQAIDGSKLTASSRQVSITPTMADHMTMVSCQVTHPALDTDMSSFVQLDVQAEMSLTPSTVGSSTLSEATTSDHEPRDDQAGSPIGRSDCDSLRGVAIGFGIIVLLLVIYNAVGTVLFIRWRCRCSDGKKQPADANVKPEGGVYTDLDIQLHATSPQTQPNERPLYQGLIATGAAAPTTDIQSSASASITDDSCYVNQKLINQRAARSSAMKERETEYASAM